MPFSTIIDSRWLSRPFWLERNSPDNSNQPPSTLELKLPRNAVALFAETLKPTPARVVVLIDGQKIPLENRGADILEDKVKDETYLLVKGPKLYEIFSKGIPTKGQTAKVTFQATGQSLRFYSLQTLPHCQDFTP